MTPQMIIFKTSGHSALYHFLFSRKLVHNMGDLCLKSVNCDVIITWLKNSKIFIMYFTKHGIDVAYICIWKEVCINYVSGTCWLHKKWYFHGQNASILQHCCTMLQTLRIKFFVIFRKLKRLSFFNMS